MWQLAIQMARQWTKCGLEIYGKSFQYMLRLFPKLLEGSVCQKIYQYFLNENKTSKLQHKELSLTRVTFSVSGRGTAKTGEKILVALNLLIANHTRAVMLRIQRKVLNLALGSHCHVFNTKTNDVLTGWNGSQYLYHCGGQFIAICENKGFRISLFSYAKIKRGQTLIESLSFVSNQAIEDYKSCFTLWLALKGN